MARNGILVLGFTLLFFRFGSATFCSDNSDCHVWSSESCCSDGVCRRNCYYCSYDFQCGSGEKCCAGGACLSSCPTTSPSPTTQATHLTYCSDNSDCDQWWSESCCSDGVCTRNCYVNCLYDFQCGAGEKCCDGDCLSSCPTTSPWTLTTLATLAPWTYATLATDAPISYCTFDSDCELDDVCCDGDCLSVCPSSWSGASIAGTVFGSIVFCAIIFSFVSCYFCAWCPYYRYRSPGAVIISGQVPYQPFVTTTSTTMTQNVPPPPNYNQPPPPGWQPPPPYSSYPQQPAQHPPPAATASGQPSMAPNVTAWWQFSRSEPCCSERSLNFVSFAL